MCRRLELVDLVFPDRVVEHLVDTPGFAKTRLAYMLGMVLRRAQNAVTLDNGDPTRIGAADRGLLDVEDRIKTRLWKESTALQRAANPHHAWVCGFFLARRGAAKSPRPVDRHDRLRRGQGLARVTALRRNHPYHFSPAVEPVAKPGMGVAVEKCPAR